jgi:hypothetical protein
MSYPFENLGQGGVTPRALLVRNEVGVAFGTCPPQGGPGCERQRFLRLLQVRYGGSPFAEWSF